MDGNLIIHSSKVGDVVEDRTNLLTTWESVLYAVSRSALGEVHDYKSKARYHPFCCSNPIYELFSLFGLTLGGSL
jgi:hypothetical protein